MTEVVASQTGPAWNLTSRIHREGNCPPTRQVPIPKHPGRPWLGLPGVIRCDSAMEVETRVPPMVLDPARLERVDWTDSDRSVQAQALVRLGLPSPEQEACWLAGSL